jgi:hypothetical protein
MVEYIDLAAARMAIQQAMGKYLSEHLEMYPTGAQDDIRATFAELQLALAMFKEGLTELQQDVWKVRRAIAKFLPEMP